MATGKNKLLADKARVTVFAVRPLLLLLLIALGAAIGVLLWRNLPVTILAWISGLVSTFCMVCATAIWGMRDKAGLLTSVEGINSVQLKKRIQNEKTVLSRSAGLAVIVCICSLVASMSAISHQFGGAVKEWMAIVGGIACGISVFSYLVASQWDQQLRSIYNSDLIKQKEIFERARVVDRLSHKIEGANEAPYWAKSKGELVKLNNND